MDHDQRPRNETEEHDRDRHRRTQAAETLTQAAATEVPGIQAHGFGYE